MSEDDDIRDINNSASIAMIATTAAELIDLGDRGVAISYIIHDHNATMSQIHAKWYNSIRIGAPYLNEMFDMLVGAERLENETFVGVDQTGTLHERIKKLLPRMDALIDAVPIVNSDPEAAEHFIEFFDNIKENYMDCIKLLDLYLPRYDEIKEMGNALREHDDDRLTPGLSLLLDNTEILCNTMLDTMEDFHTINPLTAQLLGEWISELDVPVFLEHVERRKAERIEESPSYSIYTKLVID